MTWVPIETQTSSSVRPEDVCTCAGYVFVPELAQRPNNPITQFALNLVRTHAVTCAEESEFSLVSESERNF